jgi:hypothetical protein
VSQLAFSYATVGSVGEIARTVPDNGCSAVGFTSPATTLAVAVPTCAPGDGELSVNPDGTKIWIRPTGSSLVCLDAEIDSVEGPTGAPFELTTRRGVTAPSALPAATSDTEAATPRIPTRTIQRSCPIGR